MEKITPAKTVLDIVGQYRQTEAVFKRYDEQAGECICCNALFETLAAVADRYHLDLAQMLQDIREAIET